MDKKSSNLNNFDNSQPIFKQIVDKILLSIATGEMAPGDKILAVREMAVLYNVNPNTMQKSLAKLEEMGYLFTERTTGRFVTTNKDLIGKLRHQIPTELTKKYVYDMKECGIPDEGIKKYVDLILSGKDEDNWKTSYKSPPYIKTTVKLKP